MRSTSCVRFSATRPAHSFIHSFIYSMPNIIYILTNEAMPGLVKIGYTQELVQRMRELSTPSGVPLPFECHYAAEVPDHVRVERLLHQLFSEHRVNPKREFFRIPPEKAVLALQIGGFADVTPGDDLDGAEDAVEKAAMERVRARRERINLAAIGIKPGHVLTFSRDDNRVVEVVAENKVRMNGQELSLSRAAIKVLNERGFHTTHASGSQYWKFEGETLDERRLRLEEEKFDEGVE